MAGVRSRIDDDGVAVVTLDRPEVRNALDRETWASLEELLLDLDRDDVRAVVLTGGDRWFSAGGDVASMGAGVGAGGGVTAPATRLRLAHRVVLALVDSRAPVMAAVEGFAGGGAAWGLVLACDLVIASREAFFAASLCPAGTGRRCGARLVALAARGSAAHRRAAAPR